MKDIYSRLERLGKRLADKIPPLIDYCQCPEMPVIEVVPCMPDGTEIFPDPEEKQRMIDENTAVKGDQCPVCGKDLQAGRLKNVVIVVAGGRNEDRFKSGCDGKEY